MNRATASIHSVLDSLNAGLHHAFSADERVIIVGEDLLDPYGGAFKVTRGISTAYPDRVLSSPISEAGIVGIATGMAMRGLRPVVEIMFGDFLTLAADQMINHAAKFSWMYSGGKENDEQVRVPLVIRTPMGGRRGYGPTHSQTIEKLFLGVPGLRVVAPSALAIGDQISPGGLLTQAILQDEQPVLFIENKLLYLVPVHNVETLSEWNITVSRCDRDLNSNQPPSSQGPCYPTTRLSLRDAPPAQITLTAYGYMAELAIQAALRLAYEFEVFTELVIPAQLAPFETAPLLDSITLSHRLLTIEEGGRTLGWGAEILSRAFEARGRSLKAAARLAAVDLPIPASLTLEQAILPGINQIVEKCLKLIRAG
jgi:pyruvate/2-oxoglutarate/acetoin dehydrogenase E1 component